MLHIWIYTYIYTQADTRTFPWSIEAHLIFFSKSTFISFPFLFHFPFHKHSNYNTHIISTWMDIRILYTHGVSSSVSFVRVHFDTCVWTGAEYLKKAMSWGNWNWLRSFLRFWLQFWMRISKALREHCLSMSLIDSSKSLKVSFCASYIELFAFTTSFVKLTVVYA